MQTLIIKHAERRSAAAVHLVALAPAMPPTADGIELKPFAANTLQPATEDKIEFERAMVLELEAIEVHEGAVVTADLPCVIENQGPDLVVLEPRAGRCCGMKFPLEVGESRVFPLGILDAAEVIEVLIVARLARDEQLEGARP